MVVARAGEGMANCCSVGIESPVGRVTQRNEEISNHQSQWNIELFQNQPITDAQKKHYVPIKIGHY